MSEARMMGGGTKETNLKGGRGLRLRLGNVRE